MITKKPELLLLFSIRKLLLLLLQPSLFKSFIMHITLQENEKLYGEVAKLKASTRENESAMFDENLRLKNKVAALREDLMAKDAIIKDKVTIKPRLLCL